MQSNLLKIYLTTTFRHILKHKTQSFTAIFGLAFGLVCLIPALCWMQYETSYDRFYAEAEHIYRVCCVEKQSGKVNERVPGILGAELIKQFPETEAAAGFITEPFDYKTEGLAYVPLKTLCVDSAFFGVFPQELVCGEGRKALQLAGNMVLTESVAARIFGDVEKAVGQKFEHALSRIFGPCTVTAVVKDPPANTNLPFDAIVNFPALQDASMIMSNADQWKYFNNDMYVRFHPGADINGLADRLRDFTSQIKANPDIELKLLPIREVRHQLHTDLPFTLHFIRLLVAAGLLLMFSALFNFLNLHLALFRQRAYEFRLYMIHGASGGQLIRQMLFELTCSVLLALLLGGVLLFLTFPLFSDLLGIEMPLSLLLSYFLVCGVGTLLGIQLVSMILCWGLTRWVMRSLTEKTTAGRPVLQRMAVALQLAVSVVFIVTALVIMRQMQFVNQKELGFDKEGIIQLHSSDVMKLDDHQDALRQRLEAIPQITHVSATTFEPAQNADVQFMTSEVEWPGKQPSEKTVFQCSFVDNQFAETFGLKLKAGTWWDEGENQSRKIVLNEEAVQRMGLSDPVGTTIRMTPFSISNEGVAAMEEYEVVGVVNDFHALSLRSRIHPTIFRPIVSGNSWYARVVPGQEQEAAQRIAALLPDVDVTLTDVRLTFLDELYNRLNYSEQTGLKLFGILATVCLLISLFGVYAVATAATERRRKEIAIRKIVGSEAKDIVRMFFREYTLLVVGAGAVALPLAYYVMQGWLQGYAYRTNIPWWLLAAVLTGVIGIVLLTVWAQVLKAAHSNPSEVVKSER